MRNNGKVKTRATTRKSVVSHNGSEVLQWRFGVNSIFQLVRADAQSEKKQEENHLSEQAVLAKNGVDGISQPSAIQLSFNFDLWSKLPDERKEG